MKEAEAEAMPENKEDEQEKQKYNTKKEELKKKN